MNTTTTTGKNNHNNNNNNKKNKKNNKKQKKKYRSLLSFQSIIIVCGILFNIWILFCELQLNNNSNNHDDHHHHHPQDNYDDSSSSRNLIKTSLESSVTSSSSATTTTSTSTTTTTKTRPLKRLIDNTTATTTTTTTTKITTKYQQYWDPKVAFDNNNNKKKKKNNITVGYIHIGKTGGSTLDQVIKNSCHIHRPKPCKKIKNETRLSKLITQYYHINHDITRIPQFYHNIYLITIRDPFDRTISSLLYEHPLNVKAYNNTKTNYKNKTKNDNKVDLRILKLKPYYDKCFPTLQIFLNYLKYSSSSTKEEFDSFYYPIKDIQENCTLLSRAFIQGRIRQSMHLRNNYQRIIKLLPSLLLKQNYNNKNKKRKNNNNNNIDLYVIRMTHLWDDYKDININYFGEQTSRVIIPYNTSIRNVTNYIVPVNKTFNTISRNYLCLGLQNEYKAYFQLLDKAININNQDIYKAIVYASTKSCPNLNFTSLLGLNFNFFNNYFNKKI